MLIQMTTTVAPSAPSASPEALPMELARALGDPLRWRIVELLATEQLCVAHLAEELDTAQPLVSHHLKVLRAAGLVDTDRYRYWTYYRLRPGALVRLAATLGLVARSAPSGTACRRQVPGADPTQPAAVRLAVPQGGRPMPFRDAPIDPISRQTFARSIESLAEEFRGIYSLETIERYVNEAIDRLSGARVVDFIPLFVHRFSREQLRALAQARWPPPSSTTTPKAESMSARPVAPPATRSTPRSWQPWTSGASTSQGSSPSP
jgi:ArsR family transcriptional regulator, arsenate/arsenite/antimonite-responsive transcriptional repressor